MIKGIDGHGYFDQLVIPIIENTAWEHELADSLGETIAKYPLSCAVLVRRHGMYVWGKTWEQAKRHGECLHYLFEVAIQMKKLGMDFNSPPAPLSRKRSRSASFRHLLLDIEGTTSPIEFVKDVLFPYAARHARSFLSSTWGSPATQAVLRELLTQAQADAASDSSGPGGPAQLLEARADPVALDESLLTALDLYIQRCIALDRKLGPLKTLQGLVWRRGYESGELRGQVFGDVPGVLRALRSQGVHCSLYSSGSKQAQRLLFAHSTHGDLTPLFDSYFDTRVGPKTEASSYADIALCLGSVRGPEEVLFVTDAVAEAAAARAAGMQTLLSIRPGNTPLAAQMQAFGSTAEFPTISSFEDIEAIMSLDK